MKYIKLVQLIVLSFVLGVPADGNADPKIEDIGEAAYMRGCVACHDEDGAGAMPGIPDLRGDDGPLKKSDTVLLSSIMKGLETEGSAMPMPPKGGDDSLSESEALMIIRYMRHVFGARP